MKIWSKWFFIFILYFYTLSASSQTGTDPFLEKVFSAPAKYKSEFGDYRTKFERKSGFEYSGLHWNNFVVVFTAHDKGVYKKNYIEYLKFLAFDEEEDEEEDANFEFQNYPAGAIIVKENFLSGNGRPMQPLSLTVMKKMPAGYDPENGDWLYIQSDTAGNVILEGKLGDPEVNAQCAECHSNIKERDYIFSTFIVPN